MEWLHSQLNDTSMWIKAALYLIWLGEKLRDRENVFKAPNRLTFKPANGIFNAELI